MRFSCPRASVFSVAVGFALVGGLASVKAKAADEDLPTGSEPPRIVPAVVIDGYYARRDPKPALGNLPVAGIAPGLGGLGAAASEETGVPTYGTTARTDNRFGLNLAAFGIRLEHTKVYGAAILQVGTSAAALHERSPGRSAALQYVQQAWVGYRSGDFIFEAGVMPGFLGLESFVSAMNANTERSVVADLRPYYVSGVKVGYRVTPDFTVAALMYDGWLKIGEYKAGGLKLDWRPSGSISLSNGTHVGFEGRDGERMRVYDALVAQWAISAKVAVAIEGSFGIDKGMKNDAKTSTYFGGAVFGKIGFGEHTYFAVRGEALIDPDGALTGTTRTGTAPDATKIAAKRILGGTLTFGWTPHPMVLSRLEVTHRVSENQYFESRPDNAVEYGKSATSFIASVAFNY